MPLSCKIIQETWIDPSNACLSPPSRKGLHSLHDGSLWVLGLPSKLQVSGKPQVQRVPGQHQHRQQSCSVSQLGGAKETLPTTSQTLKTIQYENKWLRLVDGQMLSFMALTWVPLLSCSEPSLSQLTPFMCLWKSSLPVWDCPTKMQE